MCPGRGGRITSLFDVQAGREWLVPAPLRPLRPLTYGSLWSSYEMAGWDDVFPTLGECSYPGPGRAEGVRLPEHGEVWALPWEDRTMADGGPDRVTCWVAGAALPYRLLRTVTVDGPAVRIDYELVNEGADPMPFQWMGYPLISARPETELVTGDPAALDVGGRGVRFAPADTVVTWAAAVDRDTGNWLRFDWDAERLPWFAFVVDDGGLNPQPSLVLSPASSWGDDLRTAVGTGCAQVVDPGQSARWWVRATVGSGPLL